MASIIGEFTKVKRIVGKRYSSLYLIPQVLYVPIPKECLSNVNGAMMLVLEDELEVYSPELEGVPVAFNEKSAKLQKDYECMISAQSCIQCNLQCEFVVFKPKVGDILNGDVSKVTPTLFGCFIHGYFYATIHREPAEPKRFSNIKVASKIQLRVTKLQVDGNGVLSITGEILEPQRKPRKKKNTEIITENGDSGIETSDLNSSLTQLEQVLNLADQNTSQTDSSQSLKTKENPQTKSSSSLKLSKNATQKIQSIIVNQETAMPSASHTDDANLTTIDSDKKKKKKSKKAKHVSSDSTIEKSGLNSGSAEVEQNTKHTDQNMVQTDSSQSSKKEKKNKAKSSHSHKSSQNATQKVQSAVNEETAVSSTGTINDASDGDKKKRKKAKKASTDSGTQKSDLSSNLLQEGQDNKLADQNTVKTDSTQKVQSAAANEESTVSSIGTTDGDNKKKRKKARKAKNPSTDPEIEKSILNDCLQQSEPDNNLADPITSQINSSPSSKTKRNSQTKSTHQLKLKKNATEKEERGRKKKKANKSKAQKDGEKSHKPSTNSTNVTIHESQPALVDETNMENIVSPTIDNCSSLSWLKKEKLFISPREMLVIQDPVTASSENQQTDAVTKSEKKKSLKKRKQAIGATFSSPPANMENIVSPTIDNCSSLSWLKKKKLFISPREMLVNQDPVTAISENQLTDAVTKSEKKKSPKKRKQGIGATFSSPPAKRMTTDTISELLPENLPPPSSSQSTPSTSSSNLNDTDAMLYYLRKSGMSVDNVPLSELKSWLILHSNSSAGNANGSDLNSTVNQGEATSNLNKQKTEGISNMAGYDPMSESTPNPEVSTENTENEAQSSTIKFQSNDSYLTSENTGTKKSKKKKKKNRSENSSTDLNNNPELDSVSGVVISHPLLSDHSTTLNCSLSIETDSSVHEKPKSLKRKKKDKTKEKKHKRLKN